MKANLGPFTPEQVEIGFKPEIGLETKVYFAPEVCSKLGRFRASAAAAGTYATEGGPQIPAAGRNVVAVVSSPLGAVGSAAMSITFDVTLDDDSQDTATADFSIPAYSAFQGDVWGFGTGRDLVPDTPGNEGLGIKSIDAFNACVGLADGIQFDLYSVPDEDSYVFIGNTTSKNLPSDAPMQLAIPEGYDAAAYTKVGRGDISDLGIEYRYKGLTEQLTRFNGVPGTLRCDVDKEGVVVWERHVYTGYRPMVTTSRGDGNEEVIGNASGSFRAFYTGYGLGA